MSESAEESIFRAIGEMLDQAHEPVLISDDTDDEIVHDTSTPMPSKRRRSQDQDIHQPNKMPKYPLEKSSQNSKQIKDLEVIISEMSRRHKEEIALMNEKIKFLMETRNGGSESAGSHRREIKAESKEVHIETVVDLRKRVRELEKDKINLENDKKRLAEEKNESPGEVSKLIDLIKSNRDLIIKLNENTESNFAKIEKNKFTSSSDGTEVDRIMTLIGQTETRLTNRLVATDTSISELSVSVNNLSDKLNETSTEMLNNNKIHFDRLSTDVESLKHDSVSRKQSEEVSDILEDNRIREKSFEHQNDTSVLDDLDSLQQSDSQSTLSNSQSTPNLLRAPSLNGTSPKEEKEKPKEKKYFYPKEHIEQAVQLRRENPNQSFEDYTQQVSEKITMRPMLPLTLKRWLDRDALQNGYEKLSTKKKTKNDETQSKKDRSRVTRSDSPLLEDIKTQKSRETLSGRRSTVPVKFGSSLSTTKGKSLGKIPSKLDKSIEKINALEKENEVLGTIISVRHDKKNLPKEIIVEAKNESGHRQFKYDLKHSYFSQRKQCFSFYMNCCTYDGCPARIVVDEEYEESRVAWNTNPELRVPLEADQYRVFKVKELHNKACFAAALVTT